MNNPKRTRKVASLDRRMLRLEPLESRLPLATDALLFDMDSWLMPLPMRTTNAISDLVGSTGYRRIPDDMAILDQPVAVVGTTFPFVDVVLPMDFHLIETNGLPFSSSDSVVVDRSIEQIDDPISLQGLGSPINIPRTLRLPQDNAGIDGLAIPIGEFALSIFEEDAGSVVATIVPTSDKVASLVFTEPPRFEQGGLISARSSPTKLDRSLQAGLATIHTLNNLVSENAPHRTREEGFGKLAEKAIAFPRTSYSHPNDTSQFSQHYQTLGELLLQNGIALATDSQLSIEEEPPAASNHSQKREDDYRSQIEMNHDTAKSPIHALPEGMLAIGGEIGIKNYRRVHNFRLNEGFIAQTSLICDDLQAATTPDEDSLEPPLEAPHAPKRFRWVAVGSTIIITHATLLARKSREASLVKWLWVKLPKFTKHHPA